jgi:hypothetical protein
VVARWSKASCSLRRTQKQNTALLQGSRSERWVIALLQFWSSGQRVALQSTLILARLTARVHAGMRAHPRDKVLQVNDRSTASDEIHGGHFGTALV